MKSIKHQFVVLCLIILGTFYANANTGKYRLVLTADPATTITIGWNQISGNNPTVYYGTQDFGTNYSSYPNKKIVDRSINFKAMNNKFARLTNLLPNTNYYFVIKDSEGVSKRYWFKTAPNDLSRLSFVAGGDSRNNRTPRQNANKLVAKLKPNAVLFGGDMTNLNSSGEWNDWFDDWQLTIASDGRIFPIVPTRGNHEAAEVIYNLFDIPNKKEYYALTFGDNLARTYTLNTEIATNGDQETWLKNDLKQHRNVIWKTVQYHKPMRPHHSSKSEGNNVYDSWAEIFYNEGVRLIVECDSHTSKTTWPIQPSAAQGNDEGFVRNNLRGTVYTGEGSWGAPLRANNDNKSWTRGSAMINQFKWIFVSQNKIELRTIGVDNVDKVSELTNATPFTIPNNLDIQALSDESRVVEITPLINPNISFDNLPDAFSSNTIPVTVNLLNSNEVSISSMKIFNGDKELQTVTSAPFRFNITLPENNTANLKVVATATNGMQANEITKSIYVGTVAKTNKEASIISSADDVEESEDGSRINLTGDLELGKDTNKMGNQKIGLRFTNIDIPRGAVIESAYIQFTSYDTGTKTQALSINIENTLDALPFKEEPKTVSNRNFVNKTVTWNTSGYWYIYANSENQKTPNLASLLQEVVNKAGWQPLNSVSFMITNNNSSDKVTVRSFDNNDAPKLIYTYKFESAENSGDNTTWLGSESLDWSNPNNWSNGLPNTNSSIVIPKTASTNPEINSEITTENISIGTGKTLVIKPEGGITANTINLNDNVVIESSATKSGFLIANSFTGGNAPIITYRRYLTDDWHLIGNPTKNQNIKNFVENSNLVESTRNSNLLGFAKYFNSTNENNIWKYFSKGNTTWGNFQEGKGYAIKLKTPGFVEFKGEIVTGVTSFTGTGIATNTFELLANPYTSFLKINGQSNSFTSTNTANMSPTSGLYIWDSDKVKYIVVNNAHSAIHLSPGQAFFTKAKAPNTTFEFNTSMTSGRKATELFYREEPQSKILLEVTSGKQTKETEIKFLPSTSSGLDVGYDAELFDPTSSSLSIYTKLVDGSYKNYKFMLQCLSKGTITNSEIPLFIKANTKKVTLSIKEDNLPEDTGIYLKSDNKLVELKNNNKYTIPIELEGVNKFSLITSNTKVLNTKEVTNNQINVFTYNKTIKVNGLTEKSTLYLYDLLGKEVVKKQINASNTGLKLLIPSAAYIVKVKSENYTYTKKIIIR